MIAEAARFADGSGDAIDLGDAVGDVVHPAGPHLALGFVIALHPHLDRREHADNFFLPHLHGAAVAVMGRAHHPCRLDQVFAAKNHAGALRAAQRLTAAVARRTAPRCRWTLGTVSISAAASTRTGMFFFLAML